MFSKKKNKCEPKTRKIVKEEKSRVMKETLVHLRELREALQSKKVA